MGYTVKYSPLPEQPCQPEENPVLPDSFSQIHILFQIGLFNFPKWRHDVEQKLFFARLIKVTSDAKYQIWGQLSFCNFFLESF